MHRKKGLLRLSAGKASRSSVSRRYSRKLLEQVSLKPSSSYGHDATSPEELAWIHDKYGVVGNLDTLPEPVKREAEVPPADSSEPIEAVQPEVVEADAAPDSPEVLIELVTDEGCDPVVLAQVEVPAPFDFDVPDIGEAAQPEDDDDLQPDVTDTNRARQLAIAFLNEFGVLNQQNIDCITSIISVRKWGTAQTKVRELLAARYSVAAVYLVFEVSEAWRDCEWLDRHVSELIHFGSPLTWREAARIVDFFGTAVEVDEIMGFVDAEYHVWRARPHLRSMYPRFKSYLLEERLAHETRRNDGGWMRNLDPGDERSFDGWTNPEYSSEWWNDELSGRVGGCVAARLFVGESLEDMLPDLDDTVGLLEF